MQTDAIEDDEIDERKTRRELASFTDAEIDGLIDRLENRWKERLGSEGLDFIGATLKRAFALLGAAAILALFFAGDKILAVLKWLKS